jgi:hypothetical protein
VQRKEVLPRYVFGHAQHHAVMGDGFVCRSAKGKHHSTVAKEEDSELA